MRNDEIIRENAHNETSGEPGQNWGVAIPKRQAEEEDSAEETMMG